LRRLVASPPESFGGSGWNAKIHRVLRLAQWNLPARALFTAGLSKTCERRASPTGGGRRPARAEFLSATQARPKNPFNRLVSSQSAENQHQSSTSHGLFDQNCRRPKSLFQRLNLDLAL
jgi:hypothetical protein